MLYHVGGGRSAGGLGARSGQASPAGAERAVRRECERAVPLWKRSKGLGAALPARQPAGRAYWPCLLVSRRFPSLSLPPSRSLSVSVSVSVSLSLSLTLSLSLSFLRFVPCHL